MNNLILKSGVVGLVFCMLTQGAASQEQAAAWGPREAEHLLNRAGFGATVAEIEAAVARGQAATIDRLFLPEDQQAKLVEAERASGRDGMYTKEMRGDPALRKAQRKVDRDQLIDYTAWWFDAMLSGEDPLRDRMTLFWHGYFTSSYKDVKSSFQMIQQNQMFRNKGMGSFGELLHSIAKDPAMLEYLDNDENRKGSPNENFAREVMELFTLGEGNYSEDDIKEAARAFTGWRSRQGEFTTTKSRHDNGKKTVFGQTGRFDGDDVLEMLLESEDCAPHVAGRLLTYFEGNQPSPERAAQYGQILKQADYQIEALLRALFEDPDFYCDEVVGQRVAGPIDYLVGISRRLELTPPQVWVSFGTDLLGQQLFNPPSVKGWDGGMSWITTSSFMQRGNLAGVLLGVVDVKDIITTEPVTMDEEMDGTMEAGMDDSMAESPVKQAQSRKLGQLKALKNLARKWSPPMNIGADLAQARARTTEQIVDHLSSSLLAIELPAETREFLIEELGRRQSASDAPKSRFGNRRDKEEMLRSFAHLILSLPEAQLN